jgi:hypothetical protein
LLPSLSQIFADLAPPEKRIFDHRSLGSRTY